MLQLSTTAPTLFSEPESSEDSINSSNVTNIQRTLKSNAMTGSVKASAREPELVGADELNAWKRGFTPQAEIWNGRLAMIGLSTGLAVVLFVRVFAST